MYLYKTDVSLLSVLRPASMSVLLQRSTSAAREHLRVATYGIVKQLDGQVEGVLPVAVQGYTATVLGAYSLHGADASAHWSCIREMLELFASEIGGSTARVVLPAGPDSGLSEEAKLFVQCGFVVEELGPAETRLVLGA